MIKRNIVLVAFLLFAGYFIWSFLFKLKSVILSPLITTTTTISSIPSQEKQWTLIATGDIIPARSVNYKTLVYKDFTWAWKHIASLLKSGDITFINLESPLLANCPVTNEGFTFCGDARHVQGLLFSGVDVVGLANNHIGNYYREGIEETKNILTSNNISIVGSDSSPVLKIIQGVRVGFLAYNDIGSEEDGVIYADEDHIRSDIHQLTQLADVIIVAMSWGEEYTENPSARQKELGHLIIDSGADLIIGNHPHWIQSKEVYKGKLIMYAHGNTIFDQMWSEETRIGVIGKYTFSGKDLIQTEYMPTYIEDYGQPRFLEGEKKDSILKSLQDDNH